MDPKPESSPPPPAEGQGPKKPATLGRMAIAKITPEELAARRKADEEEEAKKREARASSKSAPNTPAGGAKAAAPVAETPEPSATAITSPEMLMVEITGEVVSPYVVTQGPILLQMMETTIGLLGAEGKHVAALCTLATRLARELGGKPHAIDLVPCAVQSLYVASQVDRRGPYAPPELATLQKLLGPTWEELAPLIEPCAKGGLARAKFERKEAAAIAAAMSFFNQTHNPAPPAQATKMALATLRGQKWIPADALDALAAALAG